MTNKQRVHAALAGQPVDRCPVTSLYNQLYHEDHFSELTGLPPWRLHQWLALPPEAHVSLFARMHEQAPFELLQPHDAPARTWRERQEFVERDGHAFRHDQGNGEWVQLDVATVSGHARDYHANETRQVFTRADIDALVTVSPAAEQLATGVNDYLDAVVARFGKDEFILSGGVVGTIYLCGPYVGQTNSLAMMIQEPALLEYLCGKLLEQNLETIRRLAAAGGDAVYLDDATATSDMISPAMYERFSLPYMQAMVEEIHRLGHQAIAIYFGGVRDRLELIAATGADGLAYEASMKGFVNDTAEIARCVGDRMTLFSNIDPVRVVQNGTEEALAREITRQVEAGSRARGFILSPASPLTPATGLARVQRFIELAKIAGASAGRYGED
jgi:uroporphyrinogen-III decarboxylase